MYTLYIDETGTPSLKSIHPKYPFLVLSGVLIHDKDHSNIDGYSRIIKNRFWDNEDVIWHFADLRRKGGIYYKFPDSKYYQFWQSYLGFISDSPFFVLSAIVDKNEFVNKYGIKGDPYRQAFNYLVKRYIGFIKAKGEKGRIVIESSGKDVPLLKAFHESSQAPRKGQRLIYRAKPEDVRKLITGISFVKKDNNDIGLQIADTAAHISYSKMRHDTKIKLMRADSYELKLWRILEEHLVRNTQGQYLNYSFKFIY